jgi:Fur family transcriptional regulator, zinc uptake regulator
MGVPGVKQASLSGSRARSAHNHARCVQRAVAEAEAVCAQKKIRLTPLRRRILKLVWRSHEPIGAYEILADIAKGRQKAGPPTVYRALAFLQSAGLVHRLDALNAFLGCNRPQTKHAARFLLCDRCHRVAEIAEPVLNSALFKRAQALGFKLTDSAIEIKAVCMRCA